MESTNAFTSINTDNPADQPSQMRQAIKAAILLGLGCYFSYNIASGNITNYINARFAWLSYVAVALFFGLGLVSLYTLVTGKAGRRTAFDHGREMLTLPMLLVVAIPLILGTLVPSKPLGVEAISGDLRITAAVAARGTVVTKDSMERDVLDWARLFAQSQFPTEFDGQEAVLSGFVYRQPDFPADTFMVARFTVSCCVADALPIGLPVTLADGSQFKDGDWVHVQGTFKAGMFVDQEVPILQVASIEAIEQPEHPYLYP